MGNFLLGKYGRNIGRMIIIPLNYYELYYTIKNTIKPTSNIFAGPAEPIAESAAEAWASWSFALWIGREV